MRWVPGSRRAAAVLTGEAAVTLGAIGQGMVAGDLVNTAARLQSAAAPGTVLVGEATQRAASIAITFEPVDEQYLKGKAAPVAAWRAVRIVAQRRGRGREDRLEAPFVGRDAELRLLKDLFHATTRDRRVRLVSITGQAGVGKSRLAWEFLKYVDGVVDAVFWHEGRSPAYGQGLSFWALGEMVRSRADLLETDDEQTTRSKIGATVERFITDEDEARRVEAALLALLGVGDAPEGGSQGMFAAWRTYFERITGHGTVALLFEDLHWADSGMLDFIDHMLDWSLNVPILIVTLSRPELLDNRPGWGAGRRNFLALDLQPLDDAGMRELLGGLVSGLPEPAIRSIVTRAEGIPLYAVETIRMLVADGRLVARDDGRFEPAGELGDLADPGDAPRADRRTSRRARRPRTGCSSRTRPCSDSRSRPLRWPPSAASKPTPSSHASAPWSARTCSTAKWILALRNGASTRSSRPSSARSPTPPSRCATGAAGTSPRRATSSRSATTSSPARSRPTTWRRTGPRPTAPKPRRSRARRGSRCGLPPIGPSPSGPRSRP